VHARPRGQRPPQSDRPRQRPPGGVNRYLGHGFNPNSPTYQAASAVCRKYAVARKVTPAVATKFQAEQLIYARCMRTHGEPGFPDPSATGGFTIPNSVDENSSTFQAAERACKDLLPAGPPGVGGS
jgi:hypothetical protein